jgi:hypothetical protein
LALRLETRLKVETVFRGVKFFPFPEGTGKREWKSGGSFGFPVSSFEQLMPRLAQTLETRNLRLETDSPDAIQIGG